jgi:hypothetical protein
MAAKAKAGKTESLITYRVVKAHDGLSVGEIIQRQPGDKGAEYCVSLGLWEVKKGK